MTGSAQPARAEPCSPEARSEQDPFAGGTPQPSTAGPSTAFHSPALQTPTPIVLGDSDLDDSADGFVCMSFEDPMHSFEDPIHAYLAGTSGSRPRPRARTPPTQKETEDFLRMLRGDFEERLANVRKGKQL